MHLLGWAAFVALTLYPAQAAEISPEWSYAQSTGTLPELLGQSERRQTRVHDDVLSEISAGPTPLTEDHYARIVEVDGLVLRELKRRRELLHRHPDALAAHNALADSIAYHVGLNPVQRVVDFRDPSYRVEVAPYPEINVTRAATYSLWLKLDGPVSADHTKVLSHSSVSTCKFTWILDPGGVMTVMLGDAQGTITNRRWFDATVVGEWAHFAVTFSPERGAELWKNGTSLGPGLLGADSPQVNPLPSLPQQTLYIGGQDRITPGWVDDVHLYDRVLSSREIEALANHRTVNEGLVGGWLLDEVVESATPNVVAGMAPGVLGVGVVEGEQGCAAASRAVRFSRDRQEWQRSLEAMEKRFHGIVKEVLAPPVETERSLAPLKQVLLERQVTLLHFVEGSGSAMAVVFNPRRNPPLVAHEIQAWDRVRQDVDLLVRLLDQGTGADVNALMEVLGFLGANLVHPLESFIDTEEVWLRLPPSLRAVPFAALTSSRGGFAVDHYAFAGAGPVTELGRGGAVSLDRVHAFGNPLFGAYPELEAPGGGQTGEIGATKRGPGSSTCVIPGKRLYGSEQELRGIAEVLASTTTVTAVVGGDALETRVKGALPSATVMHMATHNYRLDEGCLDRLPENPLVCVGLQWAGTARPRPEDNRLPDDGLFSALELSAVDLSHHPLLVFSGCSTAQPGVSAHGPGLGLPQAAWLAGAQASVATLWDVDDWAMPTPMITLYRFLAGGSSLAASTRQALLRAKEEAMDHFGVPHPAYWAPLVVEGL